ncbi:MAG: hypothetical protein ACRC6D_08815 [Aeromonas sp.]
MNKTTLCILLISALTGCVSNGDSLVNRFNQLTNTLLTPLANATTVKHTTTETVNTEHTPPKKWEANPQNCKEIEGNLGISMRWKQQQCAELSAKTTVASGQALAATLKPRNPKNITKLGDKYPDNGQTTLVGPPDALFERTVIAHKKLLLNKVGFSLNPEFR